MQIKWDNNKIDIRSRNVNVKAKVENLSVFPIHNWLAAYVYCQYGSDLMPQQINP